MLASSALAFVALMTGLLLGAVLAYAGASRVLGDYVRRAGGDFGATRERPGRRQDPL